MKTGAENRKQMMMLAGLGVLSLIGIFWTYSSIFGSPSTPSPAAPASEATVPVPAVRPAVAGAVVAPVTKVPQSASKLDPTLHAEGMLLAESIEYTGNGRNIFSANSMPMPSIPTPVASARPNAKAAAIAAANLMPAGPPPPPPIGLKFFGTVSSDGGKLRAFLLKGDDVFVAGPGDIVGRRYRVEQVTASSVRVTDLQYSNTQQLPLQR